MDPQWRKVNLICRLGDDGGGASRHVEQPAADAVELLSLFDVKELDKYMTAEELADLPEESR